VLFAFLAVLSVDVSLAQVASAPLPDYPRKSVSELQAAALKQLGADSASATNGFVVVGRLMEAPDSGLDARWLLVDQVVACCAVYEVALPLSGKIESEDNAWVAVYGHLQGEGERPSPSRRTIGGRIMDLGEANATVTVERIVPAEKVVYGDNLLELIKSEYVGDFRSLVQASGLDDTLRASGELTLLVPHNRALADDSIPEHDSASLTLRHFVLGHVAKGRFGKKALLDQEMLVMMNGDRHAVEWVNGKLRIGGVRVIMANLSGQNGVAHIITPALPVSDPSPPSKSFASGGRDATYSYDLLEFPVSPHTVGAPSRPAKVHPRNQSAIQGDREAGMVHLRAPCRAHTCE